MLKHLRLTTFFIFLMTSYALAQQGPGAPAAPVPVNRLVAPVDAALTIKTVTVVPVQDNVNGIFSRPVENKLADLVKATHRFEYQEPKNFEGSADDFEQSPDKVKAAAKQMGVDAFFTAKIFKTPKKTDITLVLYLANDGFPITREDKSFDGKVEVRTLEKGATDLFAKAMDRIPYKGMVLSRQGNRVTIDLGVTDGVKANQVLTVDQILGVSRHPKFKFLLSTEKETIGKIKILKVDDTLSFGAIIQEKDRGVITKDAKIAPTEFVTYDDNPTNAIGPMGTMEPPQSNNAVSFGKNPREWLPENAPTFGRLQMGLGIGSMQRTNSAAISGTKEAKAPLFPSVEIKGELWITTHWYVGAGTNQGIMSIENPNQGTPATLSSTLTSYEFRGGYRFLLQDDFFGPQVSLHGGLQKHSMFIDAANPVIFTSTSYSGVFLGVAGSLPITSDRRWYLEVELNRFFYPTLTETPVTSAATADLSITQFAFGAAYRLTNRFFLTATLDLGFYSATFNGAGTRTGSDPGGSGNQVPDAGLNMSERTTQLVGGLSYLF